MPTDYLFTSESVTEGHPDKIADQISDGVLDAILSKDPQGRVAVETLVKTGLAIVAGEVTTNCYVDIPKIVRATICRIGYTDSSMGYDGHTCGVMVAIGGTDILFALDSIPAIYGLTKEPYIVFAANAFALMGLRALFFLVADKVIGFVVKLLLGVS